MGPVVFSGMVDLSVGRQLPRLGCLAGPVKVAGRSGWWLWWACGSRGQRGADGGDDRQVGAGAVAVAHGPVRGRAAGSGLLEGGDQGADGAVVAHEPNVDRLRAAGAEEAA